MTTQEMIESVYEGLGEPSDLDPYNSGTGLFDITTSGAQKLLRFLNRAYRRILNWKYPDGHLLRFPCQEGVLNFQAKVRSGTAAGGTASTITLGGTEGATDDQYTGWIIELTGGTGSGQTRYITSYVGASRLASVDEDWDTTPTATTTYTLYKRWLKFCESGAYDESENISLSPTQEFLALQKVTDIAALTDLQPASRTANFVENLKTVGVPACYYRSGDRIYFDVAPDDTYWYRLEYARVPPMLAAATDIPEIPEQFHDAMELYMLWLGLKRNQEYGGAYATKKDIEDLMVSLKNSAELQYEREEHHLEVI